MKLQSFSANSLQESENRFRATLVNTFVGIKPAILLGTADENNKPNLCIMNSLTHVGANPGLLGLIFRPHHAERHSLENILSTKYYTINHVNAGIYKQAHQTSAKYERRISEFDATGLTSEYLNNFYAPFVMESHIKAGLELSERIDIQSNQTILLIGKIQHLYVETEILAADGFIEHQKADSIGCIGLDSYYKFALMERLPYAQPK